MHRKPTYEELEKKVKALEKEAAARRKAESALRESEEKYRLHFETVSDIIYSIDREFRIVSITPSVERITGYRPDELIGRTFVDLDIVAPEYLEAAIEDTIQIIEEQKKIDWTIYEFIMKDGSRRVGEVSGSPLVKNGNSVGLVSVVRDITEHRKTEEALRDSEEKYRTILESIEDGYFEVDLAGNFTFFNDSMRRILGYTAEELLGMNNREYMDEINAKKIFQTFNAVYKTGISTKALDWELIRKNGSRCIVETVVSLIQDANGRELGFRGIARDVTDQKRTERQLLRSEKLASLGNMVAGVAHEISTPLGVGLMSASFLNDITAELGSMHDDGRMDASAIERYMQKATEASAMVMSNLDRASELLNSFKHVAVDQIVEERRKFNLCTNVRETLNSLRPQYKRTLHTIDVECPDDLQMDSYPGAFSQIITNLVMNSMVHGFDGIEKGSISMSFEARDKMLVFTYRDSGKGMDEDTLNKLYDPFFTTRRSKGGSGLGMHIVYNLVTQTLRGRVECTSARGKGTEFDIKVPLNTPDDVPPA